MYARNSQSIVRLMLDVDERTHAGCLLDIFQRVFHICPTLDAFFCLRMFSHCKRMKESHSARLYFRHLLYQFNRPDGIRSRFTVEWGDPACADKHILLSCVSSCHYCHACSA